MPGQRPHPGFLAGDRALSLLQRVHARGLLGHVDVLDRRWWGNLRAALDLIEEELLLQEAQLQHTRLTGLLAALTPEGVKEYYERLLTLERACSRAMRPWQPPEKRYDLQGLKETWTQIWGDPSNPEVQARIEATARRLEGSL